MDKRPLHRMSWENMAKSKAYGGLGFRITSSFNQALLAKQWWRLVSRPGSLAARILKAKYFPHCSIHDAILHSNASFVLPSIYNARWIIDQGGYWKVGNGRDIKIWGQKWIPSTSDFLIHSPPPHAATVHLVSDLIDAELGRWKNPLVQSIFQASEVTKICSIPLSLRSIPDQFIWHDAVNGEYSIKSGYRLVMGT